jgi:hypothetical protein
MFGIITALTAMLMLPNVQKPQPIRTIPDPSLVRAQHTTTDIARLLGRHPSIIGREIWHGRWRQENIAEQA